MTNENKEANPAITGTPASPKDEQDQVFGREAEDRKKVAEGAAQDGSGGEDRPAEPHAGGKA